ncbi:hypothetical protein Scep_014140 [Stephania cephalantha]|uniref:Uncharacterized protein n=1 Tax=Stephania cephalantha TaxID=152367 RepID=A0AAP0J0Q4_9MAGN
MDPLQPNKGLRILGLLSLMIVKSGAKNKLMESLGIDALNEESLRCTRFEGQCNGAKSGGARLESKERERKVELLVLVPQHPTRLRGAHYSASLGAVALHATLNSPPNGFGATAPGPGPQSTLVLCLAPWCQ